MLVTLIFNACCTPGVELMTLQSPAKFFPKVPGHLRHPTDTRVQLVPRRNQTVYGSDDLGSHDKIVRHMPKVSLDLWHWRKCQPLQDCCGSKGRPRKLMLHLGVIEAGWHSLFLSLHSFFSPFPLLTLPLHPCLSLIPLSLYVCVSMPASNARVCVLFSHKHTHPVKKRKDFVDYK